MRIVVGCPIWDREWAVERWFRPFRGFMPYDLSYVFVVNPNDKGTISKLTYYSAGTDIKFIYDTGEHFDRRHQWDFERGDYHHMTNLRNQLLGEVRRQRPDAFFSLDSDMFIDDVGVDALVDGLQLFDAVGVNTSMAHQLWVESWMYYHEDEDKFYRHHEPPLAAKETRPVDAIMGGKMMSPDVYMNCQYRPDPQGEDLGFARDARAGGFSVGVIGDAYVEHVMFP